MYLLDATLEAQEMRGQVIRLLSSKSAENVELALQLISAGGYCFDFVNLKERITNELAELGYINDGSWKIELKRYNESPKNIQAFLISYFKRFHNPSFDDTVIFYADIDYLETINWVHNACELIVRGKAKSVEIQSMFNDYNIFDDSTWGLAKSRFKKCVNVSGYEKLVEFSANVGMNMKIRSYFGIVKFKQKKPKKKVANGKQSNLFV